MVEKNLKKEKAKRNRVLIADFNTSTRTHKSSKDYKRVKEVKNWDKIVSEEY